MSPGLQNARDSRHMRRSALDPWFRESSPNGLAQSEAALRFEDLSLRPRLGCKGAGAEAWLSAAGYRVPSVPNTAAVDANGVLVAKLGSAEFLVEALDSPVGQVELTLQQLVSPGRPPDVYPVARLDFVMSIVGPATDALLRQVCSVDFAPLLETCERDLALIIFTSMMGVGVTAWPQRTSWGSSVTLWMDPSFANYFWTTLLDVSHEIGGVTINRLTGAGYRK